MQNPILRFRQGSFISEKPGYFLEKIKTLTSPNYHRVFFVEILHTFPSYQCQQHMCAYHGVRNVWGLQLY